MRRLTLLVAIAGFAVSPQRALANWREARFDTTLSDVLAATGSTQTPKTKWGSASNILARGVTMLGDLPVTEDYIFDSSNELIRISLNVPSSSNCDSLIPVLNRQFGDSIIMGGASEQYMSDIGQTAVYVWTNEEQDSWLYVSTFPGNLCNNIFVIKRSVRVTRSGRRVN